VRGQRHREGGPAWRTWGWQGRLIEEEYWVRGQRHRKDAPALRWWDAHGGLTTAQRWVRGIQIEG
jgi:hypothetical protein